MSDTPEILWASDPGFAPAFGWAGGLSPADLAEAKARIAALQGFAPDYEAACAELDDFADDDSDVLLWRAEERLFGSIQPSWNQGRVGTCVSFGWGRGCDDIIVTMAAEGLIDWPGFHVATEPIYAGSRVEVGRGVLGSSDGSNGSWAAEWVLRWGNLLRTKYLDRYDLSVYSEQRSREWGVRGCPDDLEPIAKVYPCASVVMVKTFEQAWKLLGNRHPIPVCSNVGFQSPLTEGFCEPSGTWGHCMLGRGRVIARRGRSRELTKAVPIQNSWGDYMKGDPYYTDRDGNRQRLPEGCFLADEEAFARILRQNDSFAPSDQRGFKPKERIDWYV